MPARLTITLVATLPVLMLWLRLDTRGCLHAEWHAEAMQPLLGGEAQLKDRHS